MSEKNKCVRCKNQAESVIWANGHAGTFWGWFGRGSGTTRIFRVKSRYFRPTGAKSPMLISEDLEPLCEPCWSDLVGRFLQGRSVLSLADREIAEATEDGN
jgi:hypothetical protein